MSAIKTEKLTKYYGKSRGIIDLNLEIEQGEFFGFIGPNGAGKSTTIRTLLGLIKPGKGRATIFGKDIVQDKTAILERTGYLPSEATFYSGMKVKDIIKLSADLRKKNCKEEAKRLCERLQLETNKRIEDLSFGNRKKVGIICALQHQPDLLILDEPTSGLDPLMQHEFFEILRERNAEGTTIFMSTHILSEVQQNCNRAAIIREGRLIACDTVDSLAKTKAKRVTLKGDFAADRLEEVRDLKVSDGLMSFLYSGEISELIHRMSESQIEDLTICEPDLEEIFMHYYEGGGRQL